MNIILDFDGTVVEHNYPEIGRLNPRSLEVINKLQNSGHDIILNTYRSDCNDGTFEKALDFLNTNLKEPITKWTKTKTHPPDWNWGYFKGKRIIYIDDVSGGVPLRDSFLVSSKMVDWDEIDKQMKKNGIYQ